MHRHSGPKVQYRTKRNRIRYRQRPVHRLSKARRHPRVARRMAWDEEDLARIDRDIEILDEQMDNINRRLNVLRKGEGTLAELEEEHGLEITTDIQKEIDSRASAIADEDEALQRDFDLKNSEKLRLLNERSELGKPKFIKDIFGDEF